MSQEVPLRVTDVRESKIKLRLFPKLLPTIKIVMVELDTSVDVVLTLA